MSGGIGVIQVKRFVKCAGAYCNNTATVSHESLIYAENKLRGKGWGRSGNDALWYCPKCYAKLENPPETAPITSWHMGKLNRLQGEAMRREKAAKRIGDKVAIEAAQSEIRRIQAEIDRRINEILEHQLRLKQLD